MGAVEALQQFGALRCWQRPGERVDGIGFTLGHGSWPVYEAPAKPSQWRTVWRAPVTTPTEGDWWASRGRFGSIPQWFPAPTGLPWLDWPASIAATRWALILPWEPSWREVGGTQAQSADNGCIIVMPNGSRYELQGMAKLGLSATAANFRTFFSGLPAPDHYRIDGVYWSGSGQAPQGSQGPWSKLDGLMRPDWLAGPWPGPVRLVGFNPQFGFGATAVKGARVEHVHAEQREQWVRDILPTGNDPRMIPCGQRFKVDITDDQIEQWLDAEGIPQNATLRASKRWFAIGMRTHGMRLSETGTGDPILESSGGVNPTEAAAWKARGVSSEQIANQIGRNLFRYGTLVAA